MRKSFIPLLAFMVLFVFFAISCENDGPQEEMVDQTLLGSEEGTGEEPGDTEVPVMINPERGYYDVVVVDADDWELCMLYERTRSNCTSFSGYLWYQAGEYTFEGGLGGMYDPIKKMLTVTAFDSGWDRGHIMYTLTFEDENSNDMEGIYCYYEFPRRISRIDALLVQGELGDHDAGPYTGINKTKKLGPVAMEHPKKARCFEGVD